MTCLRFAGQLEGRESLLTQIEAARRQGFGRTVFDHLYLVHNDWYMSAAEVEVLASFSLV